MEQLIQQLKVILGTNFALYLKSHNYHWNIEGPNFPQYHDFLNTFLLEIGSSATPFPMRCYVPGDRVWFKNPDDYSSNVKGYEGSWVIYMGGGLFTNLWNKSKPYTLETKCLEIYHWRRPKH